MGGGWRLVIGDLLVMMGLVWVEIENKVPFLQVACLPMSAMTQVICDLERL